MAGELMRALGKVSKTRKPRAASWPPKPKKTRHKKHHALVSTKFEVLADGAHAITLPVHTRCLANLQTGNSKAFGIMRAREKKAQRETVQALLFGIGISFRGVTLIRLAPSEGLDTGNLWNALKAVQDEIAAHLGIDDGPDSPATWDVGQERSTAYGVRVELRMERAKSRAELEDDLEYWKKKYLHMTNLVMRVEAVTGTLRVLAGAMGADDRKADGLRQAALEIEQALRGAA